MWKCFTFFLAQVLPEFHQLSLIHEQFESNIPSYQIVLMGTLVTTASCSRSNFAFHCKSLSSKTESEVSSISLLTFYSPAMVLLHVSTTYVSYTLYVISSKVSSSMLSTGFSSIYVSEFVSTYALTTKHMTWLNIEIFCFKLLHHIKSDPFRSLSFLFMNHQYTAALGCMLLKDVTKYLFVVQTNSHIFTMMSYFHHIFSNRPACHK